MSLQLRPWTCQLRCYLYRGRELSDFIKHILICSEDERRSYRFGITRGWVFNDRIYILRWTIPLNSDQGCINTLYPPYENHITWDWLRYLALPWYLKTVSHWPRNYSKSDRCLRTKDGLLMTTKTQPPTSSVPHQIHSLSDVDSGKLNSQTST